MSATTIPASYATLSDASTLQIQRVLPGPVERVWAYLTDGELRRQWLAAGEMRLEPGASHALPATLTDGWWQDSAEVNLTLSNRPPLDVHEYVQAS